MKGALIFNKYYTDEGLDYISKSLLELFHSQGISVLPQRLYTPLKLDKKEYDFALFFDKDIMLAKLLERSGTRVINSAHTIELCDDKAKTYDFLSDEPNLIKTVFAPLVFSGTSANVDEEFLSYVQGKLGYPLIVKQNCGSQGKQVYLAKSLNELKVLNKKLTGIPHLYQKFVGSKHGEDIRVYIIGKKPVGVLKRTNTTSYKSNIIQGGKAEIIEVSQELLAQAERIATKLSLEYGSVDFIEENEKYYFVEANSSAYMKTAKEKGIDLAKMLTEYVISEMEKC